MTEETGEIIEEEITEEVEPQPEPPAREWSDDDAEEAKALGWKDPDEWEGEKPPGYIDDPRRYMERAENFTPFKKLREKLDSTYATMEERFRKLEAVSEKAMAAQRDQYQREVSRVRAAQRKAVEEGDTDRFDALEMHRETLEKNTPETAPQQPQGPAPEVVAYRQANEWTQDPILWSQAVEAVNYMPNGPAATPAEQLAYAESRIKDLYPHKFAAPAAKPAPVQRVDGGGLGAGKKSGFSTLPPEAKRAFEGYAKEGLFENTDKGREEYFNEYQRS